MANFIVDGYEASVSIAAGSIFIRVLTMNCCRKTLYYVVSYIYEKFWVWNKSILI
jgi:hypothetical protein